MNALHSNCVLVLNRQWQAISIITPATAFAHLSTENAKALNIEDQHCMEPVTLSQWFKLPVREGDQSIGTASGAIRIPTVIVLRDFSKVPIHRPKFCLKNLWLRDGGQCQYSGRMLRPSEASIDHVIPQSRGGDTSWENCVLAERLLNSHKGARTPSEAGLKLIKTPITPPPVPVTLTLKNKLGIADWDYFLIPNAAA
ncbi:HNH endonuclease [Rubritalea marina]|uniref:HNH endonuclease n=1 Tax=Rubritalea marina TaxID=361055 RepID=UPI000377A7DE|nr:HNH endonuclease [Rubritalea marina]